LSKGRHSDKLCNQIQPISQLKANTAEVTCNMTKDDQPLLISQDGNATALYQDIAAFEPTQETMALLRILDLGNRQVRAGRVTDLKEAFAQVRRRE
jgi:PHD/YefM family antitoxin component YafN of YafNO toxin-antitoxin module